jgi:Putative prokaryotic signal transducing protein
MIRCYRAANLLEAHMLRDLLEQENIKTHVFNENAQGGVGEIPFTHTYPELWLEDDLQLERARQIIRAFESPATESASRQCQHCGELNPGSFQLCWNCEREIV